MSWSGYSERGRGSQERGPSTFSLELPGGVVRTAARPSAAGGVRVGITGGQVTDSSRSFANMQAPRMTPITGQAQLPQVVVQKDPTAELLGKIAGVRFAEKVKEAQQEAFVTGAARAASGEAMAEIASTQPWYQQIFGDTAVVEGARAYTIKAGVSKWTSEHISQMDKLAEQSPDAVPAYLSRSMKQYMTGDPATDQAMQAELISQIPSLVKEHTKQHYMLQQKRADVAATEAIGNTMSLFEQYANGTLEVDPQGAANIMSGLEDAMALQPGMDPDAHYKRVSGSILGAAKQGHFKTIGAMAGLGYIDKLSPEDQLAVDQELRKAAPAKLRQAGMMLSNELRELFRNPPLLDEERDAMFDQINSRAMDLSGVPEEFGTLLDVQDRLRLDAGADGQRARTGSAAQTALDKERKAILGDLAVRSGDARMISNVMDTQGITERDMQNHYRDFLTGLPVEEQVRHLASAPFPVNSVQADVQAERSNLMFSDTPDPAQVHAAVQRYIGLRATGSERIYHKDDTYSKFLDELSRKDYRGDNLEAAIRVSRTLVNQKQRYTDKPSAEVREGVLEVLEDEFKKGATGRFLEAIGQMVDPRNPETGTPMNQAGANINARTMQHLEAVVGGAVASSLDDGEPARQAKSEIKSLISGGDITPVGRNVIINENSAQVRGASLAKLVGVDQVAAHTLVDLKITGLVAQHNFDADNYIVVRAGGEGDETRFIIHGIDKAHEREAGVYFTVSDLKEDLAAAKATMRTVKQAADAQPAEAATPAGNRERGGMTENERNMMRGRQ